MTETLHNPPAEVDANVLDNFDSLDVDTVLAILAGDVTIVSHDPAVASREIMRRVLEATDAVAVLDDTPGTTGSDTLVGRVLRFEAFRLMPSNIGDGGVWMAVEVVDQATGEAFTMSTSAATIMAQLAKLKWLDKLPVLAKIKKADKATASGYYPLSLTHP